MVVVSSGLRTIRSGRVNEWPIEGFRQMYSGLQARVVTTKLNVNTPRECGDRNWATAV